MDQTQNAQNQNQVGGVQPQSVNSVQPQPAQIPQPIQPPSQNAPSVSTDVPVQEPVSSQDNQTSVDESYAQAVEEQTGSMHKEAEPIVADEYIKNSEPEPQLLPEVEKAGIEVVKQTPELTLADKKAGLSLAKEATPIPSQTTGIHAPLTEIQAKSIAKSNKPSNSLTWLAKLIVRQFARLKSTKKGEEL